MLGRNVRILYPQETREALVARTCPVLFKEGSLDIDVPLVRKDGVLRHIALALSVITDQAGVRTGMMGVSVDVTHLKQYEIDLKESNEILGAIRNLQEIMISTRDHHVAMEEALSTLLDTTGSQHGFLGDVRTDLHGEPDFRTRAAQTRSEDPATVSFFRAKPLRTIEFHERDSLIGRVIHQGETVVTGSPVSDPRGIGLAAGHPSISSFAGLPLKSRNEVIGMVGLANRPGGYEPAFLAKIRPLLDCCASFVEVCRTRERAQAIEETLAIAFERATDALVITDLEGEIIHWNRQAEKLLGYTKAVAVGKHIAALGKQEDSSGMGGLLAEAQRSGRSRGEVIVRVQHGAEIVAAVVVVHGSMDELVWVIDDITWRKNAERALEEASSRFAAWTQNSQSAFWMGAMDGRTAFYKSPAFKTILGVDEEPWPGTNDLWRNRIHPDDYEGFEANAQAYIKGVTVRHRYRIFRSDGSIRWVESNVFPVKNAQGEVYCLAGLVDDITEHQQAIVQLQAALAEKEALLKEIHHRVKNNLQIISSLLRLQGGTTTDERAGSILRDSRNRIETIAVLHEHLYQSENLSHINFAVYAERLIGSITSMNQAAYQTVKVNMHIEPFKLDPETAVLCGLILNELISNAHRHAFPDGRAGEITIRAQATNETECMFEVRDNGIGIPPEFDVQRVKTLGLKLVRQLTRQLRGTMSLSSDNGTSVRIDFPVQRQA